MIPNLKRGRHKSEGLHFIFLFFYLGVDNGGIVEGTGHSLFVRKAFMYVWMYVWMDVCVDVCKAFL